MGTIWLSIYPGVWIVSSSHLPMTRERGYAKSCGAFPDSLGVLHRSSVDGRLPERNGLWVLQLFFAIFFRDPEIPRPRNCFWETTICDSGRLVANPEIKWILAVLVGTNSFSASDIRTALTLNRGR